MGLSLFLCCSETSADLHNQGDQVPVFKAAAGKGEEEWESPGAFKTAQTSPEAGLDHDAQAK